MSKLDLVIILSICRNQNVESALDKPSLQSLIGVPSQTEINFLGWFNQLIASQEVKNIITQYYNFHDYNDVKSYLQHVNSVLFPIPLSYLTKDKKEIIVAFYYYKQLKLNIDYKSYSVEQEDVINQSSGITVVNAGPGTGKTTTACEKAFRLRGEGVIFLSYTTSAVKEDFYRMYVYPEVSKNMSCDNLDKLLVFKTVDSLAGAINGGISESYDHSIRDAIISLKRNPRHFRHKHIIVDETQDIDDLRCELISVLYNLCGFSSMTIFGDPRQKINVNNGNWYRDLWIQSKSNFVTLLDRKHRCDSVGFSISYRFKCQHMCNLVNQLSERRPDIHHSLNILSSEVQLCLEKPIVVYGNTNDQIIKSIGQFILDLNKMCKEPFSEFMVIGPSLSSESNKTSKYAQRLSHIFRNMGIPCKIQSEGSYSRNGVLFSTIHSAKGKEANYVFIFGMDNYPNTFNMIQYEVAESLIYIAHSRARKKIFYMISAEHNIKLPRGVLETNTQIISGVVTTAENERLPKDTFKNVTDLCKDFGFLSLMDVNMCSIQFKERTLPILNMPFRESQYDFYGIMIGLLIGIFTSGRLPKAIIDFVNHHFETVSDIEYSGLKYKGEHLDGYFNDELTIKETLIPLFEKFKLKTDIHSYEVVDFYNLTLVYIMLTGGSEYDYTGEYDESLIEYCKQISIFILETYGRVVDFECHVKFDKMIGSIDLITDRYTIEIKTTNTTEDKHKLQSFLYSIPTNRIPLLLNLNTKKEYVIYSNRNVDYWRYLINGFFDIKHIVECVNFRSNKRNKLSTFSHNTFMIDTEYDPKTNTIFEVSIFNPLFPFKSIFQIVYSPIVRWETVNSWLGTSKELYDNSPTIDLVRQMFYNLCRIYTDIPVLYYYKAPTDVSWIEGVNKFDFSSVMANICIKSGTFTGNLKVPKLIDYYNGHIALVDERINHHHALSDTLLLFEIILTYPDELEKSKK